MVCLAKSAPSRRTESPYQDENATVMVAWNSGPEDATGYGMNDIVWSEFDKKLRAYVRRRVNASAADDVVSEILLRLVRSQDKMEGAKNPMAWIYRVAANAITDHYRKSSSEMRLLEQVKLDTPVVDASEEPADDPASLARLTQIALSWASEEESIFQQGYRPW